MRMVIPATIVATVLVALAGPAAAQEESDDEARMHFRLGRAYYDSGRFVEAADEFQQAYEMSERPQLLYNVFIARRDAGQLGLAIEALEQYLERVPDAEGRQSLEARLRSMQRLHQQQQAAREAQSRGETGEQAGSQAEGGDAQGEGGDGRATDGGSDPGDSTEDAGAGQDAGEGPTGETGEPPVEVGEGGGSNVAPWVVMGVGAALMAGSVVTGLMALDAESQLEDECPDGACTSADWMDTRDRGTTMATLTDVLLITGGLTVAAGAALLFLLDDGGGVERDPRLSAGCTTDGCAASATVAF